MQTLFEIGPEDIATLPDDLLRDLVGRLCQADLRREGYSGRVVTFSGHQDARDGGVDVRVKLDSEAEGIGWIPRPDTCFQVKVPKMGPAAVKKEMAPGGLLRQAIAELVACGGAYVVVSSGDSVSDSALRDRVGAMREAIGNIEGKENIHLDFFDRGRIASWVMEHPGITAWVRDNSGRPVSGWRQYEDWSGSPDGLEDEYIAGEKVRLTLVNDPSRGQFTAEGGILYVRRELDKPKSCIRLIGLSGVGKTRFAQALFDERLASDSLAPDDVLYLDAAHEAQPSPIETLRGLRANRTRAIVVVDNCSSELHRELARIAGAADSSVSLLTIEYDVREDLPENTSSVLAMSSADDSVLEKLIIRRFPSMARPDVDRVVEFSGGNARVALSVAATVQVGETVAQLGDRGLLDRLFHQRQSEDRDLWKSATVLALPYSFDGEVVEGPGSELEVLARLCGFEARRLYSSTAKLIGRDLVQCRGSWRAVLPHALANRLAVFALRDIPIATLAAEVENCDSARLVRSICKRLGCLHDCPEAVDLARRWLGSGGWISERFLSDDPTVGEHFRCLASVSPVTTLELVERIINDDPSRVLLAGFDAFTSVVESLRCIAYDPELFERAVGALIRIELAGEKPSGAKQAARSIVPLFYCQWSGTHATDEQRLRVLRAMLLHEDGKMNELGSEALAASVQLSNLVGVQSPEFGAHPRDYGMRLQSEEEFVSWVRVRLALALEVVQRGGELANHVKSNLAECIPDLLLRPELLAHVSQFVREVRGSGDWGEAWIALRALIRQRGEDVGDAILQELSSLEQDLTAKGLLEKARVYAVENSRQTFLIEDTGDPEMPVRELLALHDENAEQIGRQMAAQLDMVDAFVPEVLRAPSGRAFLFGKGLASGAEAPGDLFEGIVNAADLIGIEEVRPALIAGFVQGYSERDHEGCQRSLAWLFNQAGMRAMIPLLESRAGMTRSGVKRLVAVAADESVRVGAFHVLSYGVDAESIPDKDLIALLTGLANRSGAHPVVLAILSSRLRDADVRSPTDDLIAFAAEFLATGEFGARSLRAERDYELSQVAEFVCEGQVGELNARKILKRVGEALQAGWVLHFDYPRLLDCIARRQPRAFLDEILGVAKVFESLGWRSLAGDAGSGSNPLRKIADDSIVEWCEVDPECRYPVVAHAAGLVRGAESVSGLSLASIYEQIFIRAPNLDRVFEEIKLHVVPSSWNSSLAHAVQERAAFLEPLTGHSDEAVRSRARALAAYADQVIAAERERERKREEEWQNRGFDY